MTVRQLAHVLARQWRVVLVVLACTALIMLWAANRPGVFVSQVDVVFLAPTSPDGGGNVLEGDPHALVSYVGIVETEFQAGDRGPRLSASSATLHGSGVREGYSVTLPNEGGQWTSYFPRPVLAVEVVGPSEAAVRGDLERVLAKIDYISESRQLTAGADPSLWIRTELSPAVPVMSYVSGSPLRGAAAIGLLGAALAVIGAVAVERWPASRGRVLIQKLLSRSRGPRGSGGRPDDARLPSPG